MGSAETSTTTRWIDLATDLWEAMERNAWEVREEQEVARLEKAELDRAEAEAAAVAKEQAEEAAHRQLAMFVIPLNSAPPPPEFVAQTGETDGEHPIM